MLTSMQVHAHWRVQADAAVARDIIADLAGYERWWPGVEASGRDWLVIRGMFGSRFRSRVTVITSADQVLGARIGRDLPGWARFRFDQDGEFTDITFTQQLRFTTPLARIMAVPILPFVRFHIRSALRRGEQGFYREVHARVAQ